MTTHSKSDELRTALERIANSEIPGVSGGPNGPSAQVMEFAAQALASTATEQGCCAVGCAAGRKGEMLLCGFRQGHDGPHAWASLPTFLPFEHSVQEVLRVFDENARRGAEAAAESIVIALLGDTRS